MRARPPGWAEWLIRLAAGSEAEYVLAELAAEHNAHVAEHGAARAARWYRGQALRSFATLLRHTLTARLRRRSIAGPPKGTGMDPLRQDVRYGFRSLARSPAFAATAILTLALGIGATTTIFSVFEAVLLRALPFGEPERLVVPQGHRPDDGSNMNVPYAEYVDWREAGVFEHVAVFRRWEVDLTSDDGDPLRVEVAQVTAGFFPALDVSARLGRLFAPDEFPLGAGRPIVISYGLWQTRFAGQNDVLGKSVRISGSPFTIVGVLQPRAEWPQDVSAWIPSSIQSENVPDLQRRDNYIWYAIARLKPDVTLEQTRLRMREMSERVARDHPIERRGGTIMTATPARDYMLGTTVPRALQVLLAAVAFVLLIGCANITNLMLARATARRREFAVRSALGAGRLRLSRQLLTESLIIGLLGGVLGTAFSQWGVRALVALAPGEVFGLEQAGINPLVLLASAAISLVCALLVGMAPALQVSSSAPSYALADASGRTTGSRRLQRARSLLVMAQLALSIMLLAGAGLLGRSFVRVSRMDPGLRTEDVLRVSLSLPRRYNSATASAGFFRDLTTRVSGLPGVEAASIASALPLGGGGFYLGRVFLLEGRPEPPAGTEVHAQWNVIGPDYFRTLDTPLLAGREFDTRDDSASVPVIIVNQRFAQMMFPGESPLGKRVRSWRDENLLREIVGVVGDVRYFGVSDSIRGLVFVPHTQNSWSAMNLLVRTSADAHALIPAVRAAVSELDSGLATAGIQTMEDTRQTSLAEPRFTALLFGTFAVLALMLAAVGVYGLLAFAVSQRTREIGVRVALGAARGDVIRLVARDSARVILPGVALGLGGAWAATRLLRSLLFEIQPYDPLTLGIVAGVLLVTALVAAALPARRAARVDPMTILRDA